MSERRVLIVTKVSPEFKAFLEGKGFILVEDLSYNTERLKAQETQLEGVVTSTKLKFDKETLDACKGLKWIARMGSGMEQIDLDYAETLGVFCCSSPDGNANAVAEQALGMYLVLEHNVIKSNLEIKQGIWERDGNRGHEIEGKVAGIIGLGNNGYRFAEKLARIGLEVLALDIETKQIKEPGIKQVRNIKEIFDRANMVSFHLPYNEQTHHYFNHDFLEQMQQPFTLLNLSRGKIVDQEGLLAGMNQGKIKAAALDVWEHEPLKKVNNRADEIAFELLSKPNFIGTSHIAGYSFEAIEKMSKSLQNKLEKVL